MKHFKVYIGILAILVFGLLLTACGAAEENNASPDAGNTNGMNDEMPSEELPTNDADDTDDMGEELPDSQMPEGPIVNLPGEIPYQDQEREPGQGKLSSGNAFVNSADLIVMESFPVQVSIVLVGELPTPCNQLTVDISEPNADNQIQVDVYSLVDPAMTCIAMIEPFSEQVSLPVEGLADGTYEVWVNGALVGEFSYPG